MCYTPAFDGVTGRSGLQYFFEIDPDQTEILSLVLASDRGTIEGYVYRQGADGSIVPIAGAVVWVSGLPFNTVTDSAGFYSLDGIFSGTRTVYAADTETEETVSAPVTISADGAVVNRDLYFQEGLPNGGLSGQVLDYDGLPVQGAEIHLAGDYLGPVRWHHSAVSDAGGFFVIPDLGPGKYGVHASRAPDGAIAFAEVRFQGDTPFVTVRFRKGTIRGQTLAKQADGTEIGVTSTLVYRHVVPYQFLNDGSHLVLLDLDPHTIQTDANGNFELNDVLIGPYELTFHNAFHGTRRVSSSLTQHGQINEHSVVFEPNGTIRGVVYDHDGETPVTGATVNLTGGNFEEYDVTTDDEGRFLFGLVPEGRYRIEALSDHGVVFRTAQIHALLDRPGAELDVEVVLQKQGTVSGFAEDANGFPVPGAVVTLREKSFPYRTLLQNADNEGNFQFANVFEGELTVSAQAPALGGIGGKDNAAVTFEAEEVFSVVTLAPVGEIVGTVFTPVDGSAVPQARVNLYNPGFYDSINTDANGEFRFTQLPLGTYRVRVLDPRTGRHGISEWVEIVENNQVVVLDATLEARGSVDGHLTDPLSNSPVPGATVRLNTSNLARLVTYSSADIDGFYEFLGIPEGDFTLSAQEPFGRRRAKNTGTISEEGERVTADLALELPGSVTVSVYNPPGQPAGLFENVNIRIVQNGVVIGASDDNPATFTDVLAGRSFRIEADEIGGSHHAEGSDSLSEDGEELAVDLTVGAIGSVSVSVYDSFGQPVPGAEVSVSNGGSRFTATTGGDHQVTFQGIREGRISARASNLVTNLRGSATGTLSLDGQTVALEVELQPSGNVNGEVVLSDGTTPAEGATAALLGPQDYYWTLDETGTFSFEAVPLGSYTLVLQEYLGRGSLERLISITDNGQVADLGLLVLDDFDPEVIAIDPPPGSRDVPHDQVITVTWSEPMWTTRSANNWSTFRRLSGGNVGVTRSWSADGTQLFLTPNNPLANDIGYEVILQTKSIDAAGRHLNWAVRSSFYTADLVPPKVIDILPRNNEVQVPVNQEILLTFSEPVSLASLSGPSLELRDLTAGSGLTTTFQLLPGERQVRLTPVSGLLTDRQYQITVQNVADTAGNTMAAPESFTFWTPDTTQPQITLIDPAAGASYTAGDSFAASANASDDRGIARVDFHIGDWTFTDTTAPYEATLTAPVVTVAGDVAVTVTAVDIFGNEASASRTIHVAPHQNGNAPVVEGVCWYEGDLVEPGVELPLSYSVVDDELIESLTITVDGEVLGEIAPVNAPQAEGTFNWMPPVEAAPGTVFVIRLEARDFAGNVSAVVANVSIPLGFITRDNQILNQLEAGTDLILGVGTFTLNEPLELQSLVMLRGSRLVTTTTGEISLDVASSARFQCGSVIDVDEKGFQGSGGGNAGGAPSWVSPSLPEAGGSHGGAGSIGSQGGSSGPAGDVYGSVYRPQLAGGGGSRNDNTAARNGGGVIVLRASDVIVDGTLQARGGDEDPLSGGAGGAIMIDADTLSGHGLLDASGGELGSHNEGPGGGGRIALLVDTLSGFDPVQQARAYGGGRNEGKPYAAPGTVYVRQLGSTYGDLIISNGFKENGASRSGVPTELPMLGDGAVLSFETSGVDVWVEAQSSFRPRWLGSWMTLLGAQGSLGTFEVIDLDSNGRALLAQAASASAPVSYRGEYRFDSLFVESAQPRAVDPLVVPTATIVGESSYPENLVLDSLLIEDGATLAAPSTGSSLIEVTETLTIGTNVSIDAPGALFDVAVGGSLTIGDGFVANLAEFDLQVGGSVTVGSNAVVDVSTINLGVGSSLTLGSGSTFLAETAEAQVAGTLNLEPGVTLDVSSRGYSGQGADGTKGAAPSWVEGSPSDAGGSHGGRGNNGDTQQLGGESYDSVYFPRYAGASGGPRESGSSGAAGGGVVRLEAASVIVDGQILARGENGGSSPAGAGGSVTIVANTLSGAGSIDASGGNTADIFNFGTGGPGGGGRVSLRLGELSGFDIEEQVLALGGRSNRTYDTFAAPGTIYLSTDLEPQGILLITNGQTETGEDRVGLETELPALGTGSVVSTEPAASDLWVEADRALLPRWLGVWVVLSDVNGVEIGSYRVLEVDITGRVLLEGAAATVGAMTLRGEYRFDEVRILHGGRLVAEDPVVGPGLVFDGETELTGKVIGSSLLVRSGAVVRAPDGEVDIAVSGAITIEAGATIDVTGLGFAGIDGSETGMAPPWVEGSPSDAGGSHGGRGNNGDTQQLGGESYDSVYFPRYAGASGGPRESGSSGAAGGGVVRLEAASVVVDGQILARGENGGSSPAGAGGSVTIVANTLSGAGSIDASGGNTADIFNFGTGGPGGGGRVSLRLGELSGFDIEEQVLALGGRSNRTYDTFAAPGTIYLSTDLEPQGILLITNGQTETGEDRVGLETELPALGTGSVVSTEPAASDLWVEADRALLPRWLGVWVVLSDVNGEEIGSYRVLEVDTTGRVLLEGAAATVGAMTLRGEYRFDEVRILHGGQLAAEDPVVGPGLVFDGETELTGKVVGSSLLVRSGSVVRAADGEIDIDVSGTITIEAGATIDVTGLGYSGSDGSGYRGAAPEEVVGSEVDAGGSHGGRGRSGASGSPSGEVYGSVMDPRYGGGAGRREVTQDGGSGGGVVRLRAASIVLDGDIVARGENSGYAGGAGGSVVLEATSLAGTGLLDASGGSGGSQRGGGGGGRVSLRVDDLSAFDVETQVKAWGGSSQGGYAAPGTVFVADSLSTDGSLIVDSGLKDDGTTRVGVPAELPSIGRAVVGSVEISGGDLWIEPESPEKLFGWVVTGLWVRVGGDDFEVLDESADRRRLLLSGAAGSVVPGDAFVGLYRFDSVTVRSGAQLIVGDGAVVTTYNIDTGSSVTSLDLEAPVITSVEPAEGALYASGAPISVTALVTDNSGIQSVVFTLDGQTFIDDTAPYEWTVSAPPANSLTSYEIGIEAIDLEDNRASLTRTIQVEPLPSGGAPSVSILSPSPGVLVAPGTGFDALADATDDNEVARVEFLLNGVLQDTAFASPWSGHIVAPLTATDGEILTLEAVAYDFGSQTGSATLPVEVVEAVVVSDEQSLTAVDSSLEGQSVAVTGSLTLEGPHTFEDLVVLDGGLVTHAPATRSYDSSLVGYWSFDDAGDPTADGSGYGNDARLGNAVGIDASDPDFACGQGNVAPPLGVGCAVDLDSEGTDSDYLSIDNAPSLDFTSEYTLTGWVLFRPNPTTFRPVFLRGVWGSTNASDIEVHWNSNAGAFYVRHNRTNGGTGDYVGFTEPPVGEMFHLAVTYDGTVRAYYNGVEQAVTKQSPNLAAPLATGRDWLLGQAGHSQIGGQQMLDGVLDEVRFYNEALEPRAIEALAQGLAPGHHGIEVTLGGDLYVASGGAIDVTGRGYSGADPFGYTYPGTTTEGAGIGIGGSHAGRGGGYDGSGRVYGSLFDPAAGGAGGGGANGKAGGGVIRIASSGNAVIDGAVRASGDPSSSTGPYGAGGSIRLDAPSLTGLGSIEAEGGGSLSADAAGSGGRVALYSSAIDSGLLGRTSAAGGDSSVATARGAAGTLYVKLDSQPLGDLFIDNGAIQSTQLTELLSVGEGTIGSLVTDGFGDPQADFRHSLVNVEVALNGNLSELWPISGHQHHGQELTLDTSGHPFTGQVGDAYEGVYRFDRFVVRGGASVLSGDSVSSTQPEEIEAGSQVVTNHTPTVVITAPSEGAVFTTGQIISVSAVVDDLYGYDEATLLFDGTSEIDSAEPFGWSLSLPFVTTTTAYSLTVEVVDDSGHVLTDTHTITVQASLDGSPPVLSVAECPADQDFVAPGTALSFTFDATDDEGILAWGLDVDGVGVDGTGDLNVTELSGTMSWSVPVDATAGTVYSLAFWVQDFGGNTTTINRQLQVPLSYLSGDQALDGSFSGQDLVLVGGTFTVGETLSLNSLVLGHGAVLTTPAEQLLDLTVLGALEIQCGGSLDVSEQGYRGGQTSSPKDGEAPAWVTTSAYNAGGSHGGPGCQGQEAGLAGEVFDSVAFPSLGGGGGAFYTSTHRGGHGGGSLLLQAGSVVLDGAIRARGQDRDGATVGYRAGAGAGGSIHLRTTSLAGSGVIDASGGFYTQNNSYYGGCGGGGRVAIEVEMLDAFDLATQVLVGAGGRYGTDGSLTEVGGTGTLWVYRNGISTYGDLILSSGTEPDGSDRDALVSPLPALGLGSVLAVEAVSGDAWVTTSAVLHPRWLGAAMVLEDAAGEELGTYRVVEIDELGRARLTGAAAVAGAATYRGEHRFDNITLLHGAKLGGADLVRAGEVELAGETALPERFAATNLTVRSGARVTPDGFVPSDGRVWEISVSNSLVVEPGALIDVSELGFEGGQTSSPKDGDAPAWVSPAQYNAAGSHGGIGCQGQAAGLPGEVFDSVAYPALGGGGGSYYTSTHRGGHGGGVLSIDAATFVLDGELRARGQDRDGATIGYYAGAGAGGTVQVRAQVLNGSGLIDASGGSYSQHNGSYGSCAGGGRVAIEVGGTGTFDPETQVRVWGGSHYATDGSFVKAAGVGTVWLFNSATSIYGDLILDSGVELGIDRGGPATDLPTLGTGTVTLVEADGTDAWVTTEETLYPRWLGAWMVLRDASGDELGAYRIGDLDAQGRALLEGAPALSEAVSFAGEYRFDDVIIRHGAKLGGGDPVVGTTVDLYGDAELPIDFAATDLTVHGGATVRPSGSVPSDGRVWELSIDGTLWIQSGGALDVSELGFEGGQISSPKDGDAPDWVSASLYNSGGSHGGLGCLGQTGGAPGDVFDSVVYPALGGGGGAYYTSTHRGGHGGGALEIDAGTVVLDGEIRARGQDRSGFTVGYYAGAGGGGSIRVRAATIQGAGRIDVQGGHYFQHNGSFGACGGGGRVALEVDSLGTFDPVDQIVAFGGTHYATSGAVTKVAGTGTVWVFENLSSTYGRLIVNSGVEEGADRGGPVTELPSLGTGTVTAIESVNTDAWVTTVEPLHPRWLGAWMTVTDSDGNELGAHEVVEIDAAGRARLAGATFLDGAASFSGEYRFDAITLRHGGGISAADPVLGGDIDVAGEGALPRQLEGNDLTVQTGAVARPASSVLELNLSGTLTIESGGVLDASELGYLGGQNGTVRNGEAPPNVSTAAYNAGGSHGGSGRMGGASGSTGEIYDSVYLPAYSGAGGAAYNATHRGGNGGGVLQISAQAVQLNGEIRSRGQDRDGATIGYYAGGGAGGTVVLDAVSIAGSGLIDVSGGWYTQNNGNYGGTGGGGRVHLDIDNLGAFDVATQVILTGGRRRNTSNSLVEAAGPGTLYVVTTGSTYGTLYVIDPEASLRPTLATPLPIVGTGIVLVVGPDADDPASLWIEPVDTAALFDLGVVGMWVRIGGVDFRILDQSADRRQVLLEGAASTVVGGESYEGVYKFDEVNVQGGVVLDVTDTLEGNVVTDTDSTVNSAALFASDDTTVLASAKKQKPGFDGLNGALLTRLLQQSEPSFESCNSRVLVATNALPQGICLVLAQWRGG